MRMKLDPIRPSPSLEPAFQPEGRPALQPHEYERGGTAKLLTLFRPITGQIRAKGVVSVTNAVLHPWLKEQLSAVLAEIEQEHPAATLPPEAERPQYAQWETWLGHPPCTPKPPLRIVLVLDNLAGHRSYELVQWFFEHGVMPLYTPVDWLRWSAHRARASIKSWAISQTRTSSAPINIASPCIASPT